MDTETPKLTGDERALFQAAVEGDAEKIRQLLSTGVNVDVRNAETYPIGYEWNTTPLMCAADKGHPEACRILIEAGADVSAASVKHKVDGGGGSQALHHALMGNHVEVARLLLDAGADPNAHGNFGYTPLSYAAQGINPAAVRLVLERGGHPNLKVRRSGYEPPIYIATCTICNTSSMVSRNGKVVMEVLEVWERKEDIFEMFRVLLGAGADPNAPGARDCRSLSRLAQREEMPDDIRLPIIEMLLNAGARSDLPAKDGWTPCRWAERSTNQRVMELLSRPPVERANSGTAEKKPAPKAKASKATKSSEGANHFLEFISDGEPEWAVVVIKAHIDRVGRAFIDFTKSGTLKTSVPVKLPKGQRDEVAHAIAIVSIVSNPWTMLSLSLFHVTEAIINQATKAAMSLSAQLKTQAIAFFSAGEDLVILTFENGRETASGMPSADYKETGKFFRKQGIYLPSCYPQSDGGNAWLTVEKASLDRIGRADLIET